MNAKRNEIARFAKLGDSFVELISYICPRKAEFFQEDLYPDCAYGTSLTAEDWFKGKTAGPKRSSMRPSESEMLKGAAIPKMDFVQKDRPEDNNSSPIREESKNSL
jgi:coronin-1B/1C/6